MESNALALNLIQRVNVGDSLTRSAVRNPQALALVEGDRQLSYTEFNEHVNRVSHGLIDQGVEVGDAIALASENSIEFLATYYACAKIGAVCVPVNLGWRSDEVSHVLRDSGARILVVQAGLVPAMAAPAAAAEALELVVVVGSSPATLGDLSTMSFAELASYPDIAEPRRLVDDRAPLTYLYTSGTTSAPKGVVGNHTAVYLESMTMVIEGQFRADDRFAALLPMFHTAQLNCHCTTAVMVGAAIFIQPGFDADALLALIETERITQIFALPMMYRTMLDRDSISRRDLSSLRRALYAMAPMPQEVLERCIEVFDCDFYLLFGQTEMSPTATIFRTENQLTHPGAVGTPVVNVQVAIMGDDGALLERGESGEIVYRGPHVMTGYLHNTQATEEAFRYGWFHSGDLGHFDEDGILWFTDRSKDVIKSGGENVASLEVEKAIYAAEPGAAEVVVVGLPHAHWSEAITAFVVPRPHAHLDPAVIQKNMRNHLDAYKIPKAIVVVDELPKTSTGKVQKNRVRDANVGLYQGI
ncbi:AMP-binding protein [Rhodococcus sp. BE178]|uniref:AMP-binding protein n=1 Tax=Rhodococcus sp. BE178 TaxID=2817737 RepID=UPI003D1A7ECB